MAEVIDRVELSGIVKVRDIILKLEKPIGSLAGASFIATLMMTIAVLTFIYGLVVVLLTHHLAERMRANPVIARALEKLAGLFLLGFGIKLAMSK